MDRSVNLVVDGHEHALSVDPRTTLLDALRDRLGNFSPKKGCDHGQCGACTVLVDGRRLNSCLLLAVSQDGAEVTTSDGLSTDGQLSAVHRAFLDRDALQCGYCTPGQVCSAVGAIREAADGAPSVVTADLRAHVDLSDDDDEIRERMSGNLCRCGAYVNIVAAVRDAAARDASADDSAREGR